MSNREAAEFLGLSPHTLHGWRSRKRGPAYVKCGGHVRYLRGDLVKWMESHRIDPAAESAG
jgi:predicted DNA-binding transcriptional regulator AlpA